MYIAPPDLVALAFGAGVGATLGVQGVIKHRSENKKFLQNTPVARFFFWGALPMLFAVIGAVHAAFAWGIVLVIWEFGKWLFIKALS